MGDPVTIGGTGSFAYTVLWPPPFVAPSPTTIHQWDLTQIIHDFVSKSDVGSLWHCSRCKASRIIRREDGCTVHYREHSANSYTIAPPICKGTP